MRKFTALLVTCLVAIAATAQEKAALEVSYNYSYPTTKDSINGKTLKMTLLCNASKAKYFNRMSEYCDSLTSTPGGKEQLRKIQAAAWMTITSEGVTIDKRKGSAPEKKTYLYVMSDSKGNKIEVYDRFASDLLYYVEPFDEIEWAISEDSTSTVMGYECMLAESDYHGRHWRAWFTLDIPVSSGPWKLRGLPGLILKAEADGGFSFMATGLQNSDEPIAPIYGVTQYDKTERIKALADEEYDRNHMLERLSAERGISITLTPGSKMDVYTSRLAIEPDYDKKAKVKK